MPSFATSQSRPTLATIICIYEASAILIGLLLQRWSHSIVLAHPERGYPPTPLWQTVVFDFGDLIAIAAIISLWRMRRSAFILFTALFFINLFFFIHWKIWPSLAAHPVKLKHPAFARGLVEAIDIFFLLLSGSIATYVYMILFHPRPPSMQIEPPSKWPAPPPIR